MWRIRDAPNLDTTAGRQIAPEYIDRYISVNIPTHGCEDEELRSLVLRVQQHHHTSTCRKATRRGKMWQTADLIFLNLCQKIHG